MDESALLDRLKTLKDDSWLESRLTQWALEYGMGRADDLSYAHVNALQRLCDHAGWLPPPEPVRAPVKTEADRTEAIIAEYERENWKQARVLRVDYYLPNISMEMRLDWLKKIGVLISRRGYYYYLAEAKIQVKLKLLEHKKSA